jgi:hypothetical protein
MAQGRQDMGGKRAGTKGHQHLRDMNNGQDTSRPPPPHTPSLPSIITNASRGWEHACVRAGETRTHGHRAYLLIAHASARRSRTTRLFFTRSDPAKSTRFSLPLMSG